MLVIGLLLAGCGGMNAQSGNGAPPRPNVIIFLADDLGYGDLASYGHPVIQTPNLDAFAKQGVRMTDMHSAATVCSPSRASILTGRNGYRSGYYNIAGFFGTTLQRDEVTVAQLLQDAGYETAFFGKWHLSRLEAKDEVNVNEMGFDYSFATSVNAFKTGPRNPTMFRRNNIPVGEVEGWYEDIITKEAADWIANIRNKEKPFFMIIATHGPHTPIDPPEKYSRLYEGKNTAMAAQNINYGGVGRPDNDISRYRKEYYGTVTQLDDTFGRFMKFLDDRNLNDNTMVAFTSDNGPEYPVTVEESGGEWEDPIRDKCFGTPGSLRGMKRFAYEGGHRVPGIVRWPGKIPAGTVSDRLFNGTDFLPTICRLAGAAIPQDRAIDGTDAFNAFLNKNYSRPIPALWFFLLDSGPHQRPGMAEMAMRKGDYVLIGNLSPDKGEFMQQHKKHKTLAVDWLKTAVPTKFELYNIRQDVEQQNDLAQQEYDTLMTLIPMMQAAWLDIRDDGPWWGRVR